MNIQEVLKDLVVDSDNLEEHVGEQIKVVVRTMLDKGRFNANVRLHIKGEYFGTVTIGLTGNAETRLKELRKP